MPNLKPENLASVAANIIAQKDVALDLAIATLEKVRNVYAGGELAIVMNSIIGTLQETRDLSLSGEIDRLKKRWADLAQSNTVPNSPPAP